MTLEPLDNPITICQAGSLDLIWQMPDDPAFANMTGWSAKFQIRSKPYDNDGLLYVELSTGTTGVSIDPVYREIYVFKASLASVPIPTDPPYHYYELVVYDPSNTPYCVANGKVRVIPRVVN